MQPCCTLEEREDGAPGEGGEGVLEPFLNERGESNGLGPEDRAEKESDSNRAFDPGVLAECVIDPFGPEFVDGTLEDFDVVGSLLKLGFEQGVVEFAAFGLGRWLRDGDGD